MQNEIRTVGDFRKFILDRMVDVANGTVSDQKGMTIAAMGKVVVESMAVEVKIAKAKTDIGKLGRDFGQLTHVGRLIIADAPGNPTDGDDKCPPSA